jgi:RND family efflux transporter MFP subunit
MRSFATALAGFALASLLAACQAAPETTDPVEVIRPVLTKTMALESVVADRFAGQVVARYETVLGFRTSGRVVGKFVKVGQTIQRGQPIAQLDAIQRELAVRTAEASLASAQAQLTSLLATEQRQHVLRDRSTVSTATLEDSRQARRAGEASLAQAKAQLDKAQEQLGYTTLKAEATGLVTAVDVEPGQIVGVGTGIVTVVQPDIREAVIAVTESAAHGPRVGDAFVINKQLDPSLSVAGVVREVSPQADPTTRTVTVRISMDDPAGKFRLGSIIVATRNEAARHDLVVPATAVFSDAAGINVWVIDKAGGRVIKRPIEAAQQASGVFLVSEGLAVGDIVVTAGANSLTEGQKVSSSEGQIN